MNHTIFIGDSILAGTQSTITAPTNKVAYILTQTANRYIHDLSVAGIQACRRQGYPRSILSAGLSDITGLMNNMIAQDIIIALGHNDIGNGKSVNDVIKEKRKSIKKIKEYLPIPKKIVIVGLMPTLDEETRPLAPALRIAQEELADEQGVYFVPGHLISPALPEHMADGAHRNDDGHVAMAANFITQLTAMGVWE
jgi:lysophospholipase L1-like esterase